MCRATIPSRLIRTWGNPNCTHLWVTPTCHYRVAGVLAAKHLARRNGQLASCTKREIITHQFSQHSPTTGKAYQLMASWYRSIFSSSSNGFARLFGAVVLASSLLGCAISRAANMEITEEGRTITLSCSESHSLTQPKSGSSQILSMTRPPSPDSGGSAASITGPSQWLLPLMWQAIP